MFIFSTNPFMLFFLTGRVSISFPNSRKIKKNPGLNNDKSIITLSARDVLGVSEENCVW